MVRRSIYGKIYGKAIGTSIDRFHSILLQDQKSMVPTLTVFLPL